MPRALAISLKSIGVIAASLLVVFFVSDRELALHLGTIVLAVLASVICFFSRPLVIRAQAFAFLLLTVGVSNAIDRYFWIGVLERGYPWPYSHGSDCTTCVGFIGSISLYMGEVATVCFLVLATVAVIAVALHLTHRSKGRAASDAPLG